jgi:hypothetical protein
LYIVGRGHLRGEISTKYNEIKVLKRQRKIIFKDDVNDLKKKKKKKQKKLKMSIGITFLERVRRKTKEKKNLQTEH